MRHMPLKSLFIAATGLILTGCATLPSQDTSGVEPIVVAAEPEAAQAGMDVLKRGGTAADAAVAVQTVLGLVEPQSSGLGGGAFMLYYDAKTGKISDYNGRETAPAAATKDRRENVFILSVLLERDNFNPADGERSNTFC